MQHFMCNCFTPFRLLLQKSHRLGDFYTTEIYFSQFWGLRIPRSGCWQSWCVARACSLVHSHLTVLTSRRVERAVWSLFYKSTNSTHEAPPSCPNYLPKVPSPITIHWGLGFSVWIWGGHRHSIYSNNPLNPHNTQWVRSYYLHFTEVEAEA